MSRLFVGATVGSKERCRPPFRTSPRRNQVRKVHLKRARGVNSEVEAHP